MVFSILLQKFPFKKHQKMSLLVPLFFSSVVNSGKGRDTPGDQMCVDATLFSPPPPFYLSHHCPAFTIRLLGNLVALVQL